MFTKYSVMGIHKTNTTVYHPKTDDLVERFHCTLTNILAKTLVQGGKDWDQRLPYVLFVYCANLQSSTGESLFYLRYGRDPQQPSESIVKAAKDRRMISLVDYKGELTTKLTDAWQVTLDQIKKSQASQKQHYDTFANEHSIHVGD